MSPLSPFVHSATNSLIRVVSILTILRQETSKGRACRTHPNDEKIDISDVGFRIARAIGSHIDC
jgi:hypothetical protein